jgi:hypothetical protein
MKKLALRVSMLALILALSWPAFIQAQPTQPTINSAQANLSANPPDDCNLGHKLWYL